MQHHTRRRERSNQSFVCIEKRGLARENWGKGEGKSIVPMCPYEYIRYVLVWALWWF